MQNGFRAAKNINNRDDLILSDQKLVFQPAKPGFEPEEEPLVQIIRSAADYYDADNIVRISNHKMRQLLVI